RLQAARGSGAESVVTRGDSAESIALVVAHGGNAESIVAPDAAAITSVTTAAADRAEEGVGASRLTITSDEALRDRIHLGCIPRRLMSTVLCSTPPAPTVRR